MHWTVFIINILLLLIFFIALHLQVVSWVSSNTWNDLWVMLSFKIIDEASLKKKILRDLKRVKKILFLIF